MTLDFNEVVKFMREFGVDLLNRYGELIIDEPTNTYVYINKCKDIEDVKTYVVYALCRPIGKGLDNLSRKDMLTMYARLCYVDKLEEFKDFIKRGFPIEELKEVS